LWYELRAVITLFVTATAAPRWFLFTLAKHLVLPDVAARVGNPGTCSRTLKCGGAIAPNGKETEFDYHGTIHVAACAYPDPPIDDADGIGYRCSIHRDTGSTTADTASVSAQSEHKALQVQITAANQKEFSEDVSSCIAVPDNGGYKDRVFVNSCGFPIIVRYSLKNPPCEIFNCTLTVAANSTQTIPEGAGFDVVGAPCRYPTVPVIIPNDDGVPYHMGAWRCGGREYAARE